MKQTYLLISLLPEVHLATRTVENTEDFAKLRDDAEGLSEGGAVVLLAPLSAIFNDNHKPKLIPGGNPHDMALELERICCELSSAATELENVFSYVQEAKYNLEHVDDIDTIQSDLERLNHELVPRLFPDRFSLGIKGLSRRRKGGK